MTWNAHAIGVLCQNEILLHFIFYFIETNNISNEQWFTVVWLLLFLPYTIQNTYTSIELLRWLNLTRNWRTNGGNWNKEQKEQKSCWCGTKWYSPGAKWNISIATIVSFQFLFLYPIPPEYTDYIVFFPLS